MGDLQRFWGEMDALRDARQDRARVLVLEAETARLRDRLARMTTIARERGDDLAFAHDHLPAWQAIRDERDRLREALRSLADDMAIPVAYSGQYGAGFRDARSVDAARLRVLADTLPAPAPVADPKDSA